METTKETIRRLEKTHDIEHNIFCPFCGEKLSKEETIAFATYHNEDETQERTCEHCDKTFWIKEIVNVTWETSKGEEF